MIHIVSTSKSKWVRSSRRNHTRQTMRPASDPGATLTAFVVHTRVFFLPFRSSPQRQPYSRVSTITTLKLSSGRLCSTVAWLAEYGVHFADLSSGFGMAGFHASPDTVRKILRRRQAIGRSSVRDKFEIAKSSEQKVKIKLRSSTIIVS
jgi:hypothetical protein